MTNFMPSKHFPFVYGRPLLVRTPCSVAAVCKVTAHRARPRIEAKQHRCTGAWRRGFVSCVVCKSTACSRDVADDMKPRLQALAQLLYACAA